MQAITYPEYGGHHVVPSRTQIDRLGVRLRDGWATPGDFDLLDEVKRNAERAKDIAISRISNAYPDTKPTGRTKTTPTLVDKLRRESVRLSQVQDIAGVRIVGDSEFGLVEQDELGSRIAQLFGECKRSDRRTIPTFGYRALHLIARVDGEWVEIQIRTELQDLWAQILERIADQWGRQVRYGGSPDFPEQEVTPGLSRVQVMDMMQDLSFIIASVEEEAVALDDLEVEAEGVTDPELARQLRDRCDAQRVELEGSRSEARRILHSLAKIGSWR